jgi:hypothetical protein
MIIKSIVDEINDQYSCFQNNIMLHTKGIELSSLTIFVMCRYQLPFTMNYTLNWLKYELRYLENLYIKPVSFNGIWQMKHQLNPMLLDNLLL